MKLTYYSNFTFNKLMIDVKKSPRLFSFKEKQFDNICFISFDLLYLLTNILLLERKTKYLL